MQDVGESAAQKSGGVVEMASCSTGNAERDLHTLLDKKLGLALPIPLSRLDTDDQTWSIPRLKLTDWLQLIVDRSLWHIMVGLRTRNRRREECILLEFWKHYRQLHPTHEIFQKSDSGEIQLSRTCPIVVHGDEGRGRRRAAFMVVSFHSMLGYGIAAGDARRKAEKVYARMEPNFQGHTYTTRFLLGALDKKTMIQDETIFRSLMDGVAQDCGEAISKGFRDREGVCWWACLLHIVGDWPFLQKSGTLLRTFNNIDKKAGAKKKALPKGVCHLCRAGQIGIQYEQIGTRRPAWLATLHSENPFRENPAFLDLPHIPHESASIWTFDLWHSVHLGVARNFIGSVLMIYQELEGASNIDDRFALLSTRFHKWSTENGEGCIVKKITKELLQYPSFPTATWHKGHVSTVMMRWIEHRFLNEWDDLSGHPLMKEAGEAALALNGCIREIYAAPVFLEPCLANRIAQLGLKFLRRYDALASAAQQMSLNYFVIMPKQHAVQHLLLDLLRPAEKGIAPLNPICTSVQQDEDFIGRPSRVSRRVTGRTKTIQRVLERYLKSAYSEWVNAGYILKGSR